MPSGSTARSPSTARLPIAVITLRPLIVTDVARATLRLRSVPLLVATSASAGPPVAAVRRHHRMAAPAADPGDEDPAGRMGGAEGTHGVHRFGEQRVAVDEHRQPAAGHRPGAALDHGIGAAGS